MKTTVKLHITLILAAVLLLPGCHQKAEGPQRPLSPVVILFDNDVHCGVDGYAAMETLQQASKGRTPYVAIVSCGDFAQGDVIGSVSRGEHIVDIMNLVGYDFITLGNHEFDYGIQRMAELTEKLQARTLCANFKDIQAGELVYKAI